MFRIQLISLLFVISLIALGCGGAAPANSTANSNTNTAIKLDPANMPPGLSPNTAIPAANATNVPANVKVLPKGATPTPGIPSEKELKKPFKPGATPTPGIPDPATIRKQMGLPPLNANAVPPKGSDVPMMKSNKKLGGRPQ